MSGRIVVGIDGSDEAQSALRWAYAEAQRRGSATLDVVMVWQAPYALYLPAEGASRDLMEVELRRELDNCIAREGLVANADDDAGPRVVPIVVEGKIAPTLLDRAKDADLLAIGAHGHGQFTGMLLGSVSLHCVCGAPCPVAVIRPTSSASPR
jgi:nucleotide-binding universal stress UspA family protein